MTYNVNTAGERTSHVRRSLPVVAFIAAASLGSAWAFVLPKRSSSLSNPVAVRSTISVVRVDGGHLLAAVRFPDRTVDAQVYGSFGKAVQSVAFVVAGRSDVQRDDAVRIPIFDRSGQFFHLTFTGGALLRIANEQLPAGDALLLASEQAVDAPRAVEAMQLWAETHPASLLDRMGL